MSVSVILIVVIAFYWFARRVHWVWRVNRIPGVESCPFGLIGDLWFWNPILRTGGEAALKPMQNLEPMLFGLSAILGETGLLRIWLGPIPFFFVADADHAEAILSNNEIIKKGIHYSHTESWLGDGLLTSTGDKWRRRRKMLTPSFHFQILEQFAPIMSRNGRILVKKLGVAAAKNNGFVPDISPLIILCALDVICETAMGERIDAQSNPDGKYIKAVHELSEIISDRGIKPWLSSDWVFAMTSDGETHKKALEIVQSFTDSVIKSRTEELKGKEVDKPGKRSENQRTKEPFMDALIREHILDPENVSKVDIREEVDTFMFEGHDTTAWGVVWCTYLLGLNPECQQRVQDEVDAIYADKDEDYDMTLDDLRTRLDYTEAVVKEAQRLYSSVPIFIRDVTTDTEIRNYTIPQGSQIVLAPSLLHYNPKYWTDPQKFKPERFLSGEKRHPYAFIPFSAGPRNCIGQKFAMLEEKALIAKIFRKFTVKSLDHRDKVIPVLSLIRKSNQGFRVHLQNRTFL